jgi:hypothetical protein
MQGWAHQLELEQERYEQECEHGIHKDSGHPCNECLANRAGIESRSCLDDLAHSTGA